MNLFVDKQNRLHNYQVSIMSKQCEYCHRRILTRKGAFIKHMRHCHIQIGPTNETGTQRPIQSQNPLL